MQFEVLRTPEEMDRLAGEWNALLAKSASNVPFLRHEFLSIWWRTLGGGEWSQGELYVATARQEDRALVGIAPLFFTRNREGEDALMLLGSIEISDYLDIIVPLEWLPAFVRGLFEEMDGPQWPAWQTLDWYNLLESSATLPVLRSAAEALGWAYSQEILEPAPYISLPGDWEIYLSGLDKKQRHEVRRKMRRAERNSAPVNWYIVQDETVLEAEIEAFLDLMAEDRAKGEFLTEVMRSQIRDAVWAAFRAGWLQLAFLEVGGEKAAGYLDFDYGNHIWVYNSGISARFQELSPGWVLLGYLLRWANEKERDAFDFLRGGEDYKYRFGGVNRYVIRARVRR